ncbi:MAG: winged helix-turn-helix domain-containing protein [Acidiferrobacterales bacterium]|nr:winged helix-turn-helix domain-containing protein [Acidiferrobacterales bacterium]
MSTTIKSNIQLGSVRFNPENGTLIDSANQDIALRPQSLEVLKVLAENLGELVNREDLISTVWGSISVTDDSLIQCIADIRKAIGDSDHKIIHTVPKKGYKLVSNPPKSNLPSNQKITATAPLIVVAALAIIAVIGWFVIREESKLHPVSLAILPFRNTNVDVDQTYFAEAMTKAITTNVSKFEGLFVVSDYSAFKYRDTDISTQQIAEELGVRYLFAGGVLPGPEKLRVDAQLIDGETGRVVWAEQFKVPRKDVFLVQEELSAKLATSLVSQVEIATEQLSWQRERTNLNAYELLLRADLPKIERHTLNEGIALLQNAVEIDPNFSQAHALIGHYYMLLWRHSLAKDLELALTSARKWTAHALSINGLSHEAYKTLGTIQLYADEDHDAALASLNRSLEINPNDADTMVKMATLLTFMDQHTEANYWIDKAYQQNPLHPTWYNWNASFVYAVTGQYERANIAAQKALVVFESSASIRRILIYGYAMLDDWDTARRYAREILDQTPDFRLSTHMRNSPFQNSETKQHIFSVLQQAGLPL